MSFDKPISMALTALALSLCLLGGCDGQARQNATTTPQDPAAPTADTPGTGRSSDVQSQDAGPSHQPQSPTNPRVALTAALAKGLIDGDASDNEKLQRILQVAGVSDATQVLVFSKTSLQDRLISPSRPRALYFNDDCYIGHVPGGLIEYSDADSDPAVGSGFFAIDPRGSQGAALMTDDSCLNCHGGSRTNDRPGFLIRSVFTDQEGFPITSAGSELVGHDTPITKRWGGWYVTGLSGNTHHRGNQTATALPNGDAQIDLAKGSNITDLSPYFKTDRYLRPTSDIVALMVLEHQVQMHNLLTQGSSIIHEQYERSRSLAEHLGETFDPANYQTLQSVLRSQTDKIVKHLLFCEEVALTEPVVGDEAFEQSFRANRREDSLGRSLKDFDLTTRLFKYRCSYMVYSQAFVWMPDLLKDAVKAKLRGVLTGQDSDAAFEHLDLDEKQAILQILQETGVL